MLTKYVHVEPISKYTDDEYDEIYAVPEDVYNKMIEKESWAGTDHAQDGFDQEITDVMKSLQDAIYQLAIEKHQSAINKLKQEIKGELSNGK